MLRTGSRALTAHVCRDVSEKAKFPMMSTSCRLLSFQGCSNTDLLDSGGTPCHQSKMKSSQSFRWMSKRLPSLQNTEWTAIYRYPGVRYCALLARAKLAQTVASLMYLPYASHQFLNGFCDATWFYSTASLAVAAPVLLIVFSRYLNRLVGVIAMNTESSHVRIGYLSFWGSRRNKLIEVEEVLPLSETMVNHKQKLIKLCWYSSQGDYLLLSTAGCEILDEEKASMLFGNLSFFTSYPQK